MRACARVFGGEVGFEGEAVSLRAFVRAFVRAFPHVGLCACVLTCVCFSMCVCVCFHVCVCVFSMCVCFFHVCVFPCVFHTCFPCVLWNVCGWFARAPRVRLVARDCVCVCVCCVIV